MADKIYDWDDLERRYVTDELKNLGEVAKAAGSSKRFVEKQSSMRRWKAKKQEFKNKVNQAIEKDIIKEQVSEAKKARQQLLSIADLLLNQGVQRFIDPETGKPMKNAIHNMQTAITGISVGSRIKTDLLGLKQQDEEKGETNIYQNIQNQNNNFEGISDAELESIIAYGRQRLGMADGKRGGGGARKKGGKK